MADSLRHLRKMKRRVTHSHGLDGSNVSAVEKVLELEKLLGVFRAEVDMKLKIMEQILSTRNEQVAVQKKLLEREQTLYDSLLGHWKNTPKLAATGLKVNFGETSVMDDFEGNVEENQQEYGDSDDDYDYQPEGPIGKKSKSSLRRRRKSVTTASKKGTTFVSNSAEQLNGFDAVGTENDGSLPMDDGGFKSNDDNAHDSNEWFVKTPSKPTDAIRVKHETDDDGGTLELEDDIEDVELETFVPSTFEASDQSDADSLNSLETEAKAAKRKVARGRSSRLNVDIESALLKYDSINETTVGKQIISIRKAEEELTLKLRRILVRVACHALMKEIKSKRPTTDERKQLAVCVVNQLFSNLAASDKHKMKLLYYTPSTTYTAANGKRTSRRPTGYINDFFFNFWRKSTK